jgi:tRNA pseudouridine13 synthase
MSGGEVAKLETSVADSDPVLREGLEHAGLKQERRPLRLLVPDLEVEQENDATWVFSFFLPAGSYATSVMRELVDYQVARGAVEKD